MTSPRSDFQGNLNSRYKCTLCLKIYWHTRYFLALWSEAKNTVQKYNESKCIILYKSYKAYQAFINLILKIVNTVTLIKLLILCVWKSFHIDFWGGVEIKNKKKKETVPRICKSKIISFWKINEQYIKINWLN